MKKYDVVAIGTGSAMNIVSAMMQRDPSLKVAVIDKDEPGGICLTRGCIPSKLLLYPAELVRTMEDTARFGIENSITRIDFARVMKRMRNHIDKDINMIRRGLSQGGNLDYYNSTAEFTGPYTLAVEGKQIKGDMIFLCTGSEVLIPPIDGLDAVGYHTSDTVLHMTELPKSIAIVGGGYIAAEYGHFFSAMGSRVTIIGRNPQFLPQEEPEISAVAKHKLGKHMKIITGHEVKRVKRTDDGRIKVIADHRGSGKMEAITAHELLIASSRSSNSHILHPERAGIEADERGWIRVNEYMETTLPNVWAFGDATGKYLFKHAANYESTVVYYNAVKGAKMKVDHHAVPHAVFTYPEIAGVGMIEKEAIDIYGEGEIVIGFQRFEDTAKGSAMGVKDCFVKVILRRKNMEILGAHIIGPHASILIQEIINLMYTKDRSAEPVMDGMHIHPALSEVVERAFGNLDPPGRYRHVLAHQLRHILGDAGGVHGTKHGGH